MKNIVEKSVKEMNMERVLNGINEAWLDMNFDHEKHPRTGVTMLKASEELIETLEENQVYMHSYFYCRIAWLYAANSCDGVVSRKVFFWK